MPTSIEYRIGQLEANASASKPIPALAEMLSVVSSGYFPIYNPTTQQIEKIKLSLLGIDGVSVGNNVTVKFINITTPNNHNIFNVRNAINSLSNFDINANQLFVFKTVSLVTSGVGTGFGTIFNGESFDVIKKNWVFKIGKGNYGSGGTQITINDISLFSKTTSQTTQPLSFDLGEIGTADINDSVDANGPFGVSEGTVVVFLSKRDGADYMYLWIGGQETIGVGYDATDITDYLLLTGISLDPNDEIIQVYYDKFYLTSGTTLAALELTEKFYVVKVTQGTTRFYFASKNTNIENFENSRIYLKPNQSKHDLEIADVIENGYNFWLLSDFTEFLTPNIIGFDFEFWRKNSDKAFDGNRQITRVGLPIITPGGTTVKETLNNFLYPPVSPISGLTNISQSIEEGSNIVDLVANITFTQNDAGVVSSYSLERNGTEISTIANNLINETNIVSQIQYQGFVSYLIGTGIPAGTISTPMRTIIQRLNIWFGAVSSIPTSSSQVRGMADNVWNNASQIILETGVVEKDFVVAISSSDTMAASLVAQDITNNISLDYDFIDTVTVSLPTGTKEYRIYALSVDNPYPSNAQHQIQV